MNLKTLVFFLFLLSNFLKLAWSSNDGPKINLEKAIALSLKNNELLKEKKSKANNFLNLKSLG